MGFQFIKTGTVREAVGSLANVTTTATGAEIDLTNVRTVVAFITATAVSTGGTVVLEARVPVTGSWVVVDTTAVAANGTTVKTLNPVPGTALRARVSARTDGTYSAVLQTIS